MKSNLVYLTCWFAIFARIFNKRWIASALDSSPGGRRSISSRMFLLERYLSGLLDEVRGGSREEVLKMRPIGMGKGNSSEFIHILDFEADIEDLSSSTEEESIDKTYKILYRYFGRSRTRTRPGDSIPFILLGPNVDHWKPVGEALAWHGFNAVAITTQNRTTLSSDQPGEGSSLVQAVLDALRWPKAVLVGYGNDAIIALEAALSLSPHRVAGLVLCGDLTQVQNLMTPDSQYVSSLDEFLQDHVLCPSTIIWEGHYPRSKTIENQSPLRTVILGGGSAPHRRLPDQFAWVLSRFTEEKVTSNNYLSLPQGNIVSNTTESNDASFIEPIIPMKNYSISKLVNLFKAEPLAQVVSPGTFLVTGRVLATGLFYISAASVMLYQHQNLKLLMDCLRSPMLYISSFRKRGMQFLITFFTLGWSRRSSPIDNKMDESTQTKKDSIDMDNDYPIEINQDFDDSRNTAQVPQFILHGLDSILS